MDGEDAWILFPWTGTRVARTLNLLIQKAGFESAFASLLFPWVLIIKKPEGKMTWKEFLVRLKSEFDSTDGGFDLIANTHVEMLQTEGAPAVFAERKGRSNKTLIFYNHYDVQPAEPLELWESPPFVPTFRDGKLYARGVNDDKGHITSRLLAIDALLANEGELPCNIKFFFEGEEEAGEAIKMGKIKSGDVLIIRYEGPKGGPDALRCQKG